MTRNELVQTFRTQLPELSDLSDEQLLWRVGTALEKQDKLGDFPALETELIRQRAEVGIEDRGFFSDVGSAAARGFSRGAQNFNVIQGAADPVNAQDIADWQKHVAANPVSTEFRKFQEAQGFWDSAKAFVESPLTITAEVMAESLAQSLPSLAGMAIGAKIGGLTGGTAGVAGGPAAPATVPIGALVGAGVGAATGSFLTEYASKILGVLEEAGMDPSDPESVAAFFSNEGLMSDAKTLAIKRAVPVALFDGFSAGVAGKFLRPVLGAAAKGATVPLRSVVGRSAAEVGMQAAAGMAGEYGGQLAAGEPFSGKDIFLEGLGEIGGAPAEVYTNIGEIRGTTAEAQKNLQIKRAVANAVRASYDVPVGQVAATAPAAPDIPASPPPSATTVPTGDTTALATKEQLEFLVNEVGVEADLAVTLTYPEAERLIINYREQQKRLAVERAVRDRAAAARQAVEAARLADQNASMAEGTAPPTGPNLTVVPMPDNVVPFPPQSRGPVAVTPDVPGNTVKFPGLAKTIENAQPVSTTAPVTTPLTGPAPTEAKPTVMSPTAAKISTPAPSPAPATVNQEVPSGQVQEKGQGQGNEVVPTPVAPAPAEPVAPAPAPSPAPAPAPSPAPSPAPAPTPATPEPNPVTADRVVDARPADAQSTAGHLMQDSDKLNKGLPRGTSKRVLIARRADGTLVAVPIKNINVRSDGKVTSVASAVVRKVRAVWKKLLADKYSLSEPMIDKIVDAKTEPAPGSRNAAIKQEAVNYGLGMPTSVPLGEFIKDHTPLMTVDLDTEVSPGIYELDAAAYRAIAGKPLAAKPEAPAPTTRTRASEMDRQRSASLEKIFSAEPDQQLADWMAVLKNTADDNALVDAEKLADDLITRTELPFGEGSTLAAKLGQIVPALQTVMAAREKPTPAAATAAPTPATAQATAPLIERMAALRPQIVQRLTDFIVGRNRKGWEQRAADALGDPAKFAELRNRFYEEYDVFAKTIEEFLSDPSLAQIPIRRLIDEAVKDNLLRVVSEDMLPPNMRARRNALTDVRQLNNPQDYLANDLDLSIRFVEMLNLAVRRGIPITLTKVKSALQEGGRYKVSDRATQLLMVNLEQPTRQNLIALVHELLHDVTENVPEVLRLALFDAFERLKGGELAFWNNPEADPRVTNGTLKGEEAVRERMVEHLTLWGIDRQYSRGLVATMYRTVKDLLIRGAAHLQSFFTGKENVSGWLARKWAENQVAALLAGDTNPIKSITSLFTDRSDKGGLFLQNGVLVPSNQGMVLRREGPRLAPNGKPSNLNPYLWELVRTPEFKRWFGDWEKNPSAASKVLDENGEPRVVYHGTRKDIEAFDKNRRGRVTRAPSARKAFFFTNDPEVASGYAELGGDSLYNAKVRLERQFNDRAEAMSNGPVSSLLSVNLFNDFSDLQQYSEIVARSASSLEQSFQSIQDNLSQVPSEVLADTRDDIVELLQRAKMVLAMLRGTPDRWSSDGLFFLRQEAADLDKKLDETLRNKNYPLGSRKGQDERLTLTSVSGFLGAIESHLNAAAQGMYSHQGLYNALRESLSPENIESLIADHRDAQEEILNLRLHGRQMYPVFVRMIDPLLKDYKHSRYREVSFNTLLIQAAQGKQDGAIFLNVDDSVQDQIYSTIYAVFEPSDIKSIFNPGQFDPNRPEILARTAPGSGFLDQFRIAGSTAMSNHVLAGDKVPVTARVNLVTGRVEYRPLHQISPEAAEWNIRSALDSVEEGAVNWGLTEDHSDIYATKRPATPAPNTKQATVDMMKMVALKTARIEVAAAQIAQRVYAQLFANLKQVTPDLTAEQRRILAEDGNPAPTAFADVHEMLKALRLNDPFEAEIRARDALERHLADRKISVTKDEMPDTIDLAKLPVNEREAVDVKLSHEIEAINIALSKHATEQDRMIARLEKRAAKNQTLLRDILRNPLDWKVQHDAATRTLRIILNSIRRDLHERDAATHGLGEATGVLATLAGEADRRALADKFTEKLLDGISLEGVKLNPVMRALYELEDRLKTSLTEATTQQIRDAVFETVRENPDSPLAGVTRMGDDPNAEIRGTAVLTALIRFVQRNGEQAEILRANIMRTEADVAALRQLQDLIKLEGTDKFAEALRTLAQAKHRSANVIHKVMEQRRRAMKEQILLAELRQKKALSDAIQPAMRTLHERAKQRLEQGDQFDLEHGGTVLLPKTENDSDADVRKNAVRIDVYGQDAQSKAEWLRMLDQQAAWLRKREGDPDLQTEIYFTVRDQFYRMAKVRAPGILSTIRTGIMNGRWFGLASTMERTGTRSGQLAAQMLNHYVRIVRQYDKQCTILGKKYDTLKGRFLRAAGISTSVYKDTVYDRMHSLLNKLEGTYEENLPIIWGLIRQDAQRDMQVWSERPGVYEAFRELYFNVRDQIAFHNKIADEQYASRVRDDELTGESLYSGRARAKQRRRITRGVEGGTFTRHLSKSIKGWFISNASRYDRTVQLNDKYHEALGLARAGDPAALETLRQILGPLFDASAQKAFVQPVLFDETGYVTRPKDSAGIEIFMDPVAVRELYAKSGGDIVRFFELVHAATPNTEEERAAYVSRRIESLLKMWGDLAKYAGAYKVDDNISRMVQIAHYGIDARIADTLPDEFVAYREFSPEENRSAAMQIAASAAFGRDADNLLKALGGISDEANALLSANGFLEKKGWWDELKKSDPAKYRMLSKYRDAAGTHWTSIAAATLNHDHGFVSHNKIPMEVFSGILTGMTAGMKTAIRNLIGPTAWTTLLRSNSAQTWGEVASSYGLLGKVFLAGVGRVFGMSFMNSDPRVQLIFDAGLADPAAQLTHRELVGGEYGVDNQNENGVTGRVAKYGRKLRRLAAMTKLGGRQKGGAILPALRLNPFAYTQELTNFVLLMRMINMYDGVAKRGAAFLRSNPDRKGTPLTAKDLGIRDQNMYASLVQEAENVGGFTIEELAESRLRSENRDDLSLSYLQRNHVAGMNNIVLDRMTLEGSFNNTPNIGTRSKLGQAAFTFIRWPIAQTANIVRTFEDPAGRRDMETMLRGLKVMAIGLLPMSVAFGLGLDEYDEWLGKKQPKRPLNSGDPLAIWDNIMQAGTLGIAGDLVDAASNSLNGTGRNTLSLDERIVAVSTILDLIASTKDLIHMGPENWNYANAYRRLLTAAGGGGIMQNLLVADRLFNLKDNLPGNLAAPFKAERSVAARTNVNNWLRIAGANVGMEIRSMGGGAYTPNEMTPHITDMVLATLQNDRDWFQRAWSEAVRVARESGETDPVRVVRERFAARHPLKSVFKSTPSAMEVRNMVASLPDDGKAAVVQAIQLMNLYGSGLGIAPFNGSTDLSEKQRQRMFAPRKEGLVEGIRDRLTNLRNSW